MTWELGALAVPPEDLGSVPGTYSGQLTTAYNASSRDFNAFLWPLQANRYAYTQVHIHK